jgi:GAF domain-containing protein
MPHEREHSISDTFVDLADTLASDYDIVDFLHLLVERCQSILCVDAGGVLLKDLRGDLRLVAATSDKMQQLEESEIRLGEGPCIDAYREVQQVVAEDLGQAHGRWPQATPDALAMGLHAVYAFPLRLRSDCIGALNMYREKPGPFDGHDVRMAQAFADVAAIGVLQARSVTAADERAEQLQLALNSRVVIEQAKGVIAAQKGVSPSEAFDVLRRRARSQRIKLHEVAAGVVQHQSAN